MHKYTYDGPVLEFGRCICDRWEAETMAVSEAKAKSNLTYQFKRQYGKVPAAKISLAGKITLVN